MADKNEIEKAQHVILMEEEKIGTAELPKEIKEKIKTYNMLAGQYKAKPTDPKKTAMKKADIEIADAIQDHLEKDANEETPEEITAREKKVADDKIAAEKAEADRIAAEKETAEKEAATIEAKRKEDEEKAKSGKPDVQLTPEQKKALQVEAELAALFTSGKKDLTLAEVKQTAPTCYADIFAGYKDGDVNGVGTSRYKLTEKEKEKFELTKI